MPVGNESVLVGPEPHECLPCARRRSDGTREDTTRSSVAKEALSFPFAAMEMLYRHLTLFSLVVSRTLPM